MVLLDLLAQLDHLEIPEVGVIQAAMVCVVLMDLPAILEIPDLQAQVDLSGLLETLVHLDFLVLPDSLGIREAKDG